MDDTPRITELRKKLEKDPGSRVFAQLAEELRKEGRLEDAIEVGRRGLDAHPNYPSARLTVARALLDSGRASEARPDLEQVVRTAPDNILASRLLGEALEELGEPAEALRQFEHTLRLAPGDKGLVDKIAELSSRAAQPPSPPAPTAAAVASSDALPSPAPEGTLPSALPDEALPPAIPDEALPPALPEAAARSAVPDKAPPSALPDEALPPAVPDEALPSALPDEALPSALPEAVASAAPEAPSVRDAAPPAPAAGVVLDRDLASGTFSPGTLKAPDLQDHFDRAAVEEAASASASPPDSGAPLPPGETPQAPADELPSVEVPPDGSDVGGATLPLTSLTLADLYLQQGLKAEASAVLSQVMEEEPDNEEARSRFAAVSSELAQAPPAGPLHRSGGASGPPPGPLSEGSGSVEPRPLTRERVRTHSISLLEAFLGAVEREALQQTTTGRGAS